MRPIIEGDAAAFERAVVALGGEPGENPDGEGSGAAALLGRLESTLVGARLDLDASAIIGVDATKPGAVPMGLPNIVNVGGGAGGGPGGGPGVRLRGIPIMVEASETADDATGELFTMRSMSIPLSSLFPEAAERARNGARTVEVWAPGKLAGEGGSAADIGPSAYFVYDEKAGAWQPVALRVALVSEAARGTLGRMMRRD